MRMNQIGSIAGMLILVSGNVSFAQGNGSHGGDVLVGQFTGSMSNLIKVIGEKAPVACPLKTDLDAVFRAVRVYSKPVAFCDGHEQDACSYTDSAGVKTTDISRTRLIQITNAPLYMNLVLHEYYVHLGLESTNQMDKSKGCLDALSTAGVNVGSLMNQISPLTSIEQQISEGKIVLQADVAINGLLRIDFANSLQVPRCTDQVLAGGTFPSTRTDCSNKEHFPYVAVVKYTVKNSVKKDTRIVAFLSKTPFTQRLSGEYDIATGQYKLVVRYNDLEIWDNRGQDGYFHPTKNKGSMKITTSDHANWSVSFSEEVPHLGGWNLGVTPILSTAP